MKATVCNLLLIILMSSLLACGSDDDSEPAASGSLGTFAGSIQVVDDPQTELGYILNAKVSVTRNGNAATIKIIGTPAFDREYTGTITAQTSGVYMINLDKQTKPTEKTAGDQVVISDNKLTIGIDLAGDNVQVRDSPSSDVIIEISGKISMIGTDMLKE